MKWCLEVEMVDEEEYKEVSYHHSKEVAEGQLMEMIAEYIKKNDDLYPEKSNCNK